MVSSKVAHALPLAVSERWVVVLAAAAIAQYDQK